MAKTLTLTDQEVIILHDALCARRKQVEQARAELPGYMDDVFAAGRAGLCKLENKVLDLLGKKED